MVRRQDNQNVVLGLLLLCYFCWTNIVSFAGFIASINTNVNHIEACGVMG